MNRRDFLKLAAYAIAGVAIPDFMEAGEKMYFPLIVRPEFKTIWTVFNQAGKHFGSCIEWGQLASDPAEVHHFKREFRRLTPEFSLKLANLYPVQGDPELTQATETLAYAKQDDMLVHGHTFLWQGSIPAWVQELDEASLNTFLHDYIADIWAWASPLATIDGWDIVNEPWDGDGNLTGYFCQTLGASYLEAYLEYALSLGIPAFVNTHLMTEPILQNLVSLAADGLITGAGLQFHIRYPNAPNLSQLSGYVNQLKSLGVNTRITELDVAIPNPASSQQLLWQKSVYFDILNWALEHPGVTDVTVWNSCDKCSWIPWYFPGYGLATLWTAPLSPKNIYTDFLALH